MVLWNNMLGLGTTPEDLYDVRMRQSPSYQSGNGLGWLPEEVILEKLYDTELIGDDTAVTGLESDGAGGFKQRFAAIKYYLLDWSGFPNIQAVGRDYGTQGRFELHLIRTGPGAYEIQIKVYWKLDLSRVTRTAEQVLAQVNESVGHYWGAPPTHERPHYELLSRDGDLVIPMKPAVLEHLGDGFHFDVEVWPDSSPSVTDFEVVQMSGFTWAMRDTHSFASRHTHSQAGRGPHEVGHMMGIPHDLGDFYTVMSTRDDTESWKYYSPDAPPSTDVVRPYTAHFKVFKVWAEVVFANHLNRLEDFIVRSPYESQV